MAMRVCRHYDSQSLSAMITQLAGAVNAAGLTVPPPPTTLAAPAEGEEEGEPLRAGDETMPEPSDEESEKRSHRRPHR